MRRLDWIYGTAVLACLGGLLWAWSSGLAFQLWMPALLLYMAMAGSALLARHMAYFEPEWDRRLKPLIDVTAGMQTLSLGMFLLIHYYVLSEGARLAFEAFFTKSVPLAWLFAVSLATNAFLVFALYGLTTLLNMLAKNHMESARERYDEAKERHDEAKEQLKFIKEHFCSLCGDCITLDTPHVVAEEDRRSHLACTLREYSEHLPD